MNTALLVLDVINDIVHPNGKIASSADFIQQKNVLTHINETINLTRKNNIPVIFFKVAFSANYLECPENSPLFSKVKQLKALQFKTWGTEIHDEINQEPDDLILIKHRVSAFYATPLEAILRAQQIKRLIICGVSTDMAVQTTAREAHDRDYQTIIISNACATASTAIHEGTLSSLQKLSHITSVNELDKVLTLPS